MEMVISFPGGKRVDATFDGLTVHTDQPVVHGGDGSAAAPFDLFLASLATCAGYYVLAYCQARSIPTDGISLTQRVTTDPATKLPKEIVLQLKLPDGFPDTHRAGVLKAAEYCKVKKLLAKPPVVTVEVAGDAAYSFAG